MPAQDIGPTWGDWADAAFGAESDTKSSVISHIDSQWTGSFLPPDTVLHRSGGMSLLGIPLLLSFPGRVFRNCYAGRDDMEMEVIVDACYWLFDPSRDVGDRRRIGQLSWRYPRRILEGRRR